MIALVVSLPQAKKFGTTGQRIDRIIPSEAAPSTALAEETAADGRLRP
jgi:hypothetical protein